MRATGESDEENSMALIKEDTLDGKPSRSRVRATAVIAADLLSYRKSSPLSCDARTLVERTTQNAMLSLGPFEVFSNQRPTHASSKAEGLAPIDALYGIYKPKDLEITIFVENIKADADRFRLPYADFLSIVRLHEYAHAIVHLGIDCGELIQNGIGNRTYWDSFRKMRDEAFAGLDRPSHEFLAQAITLACLASDNSETAFQGTIGTFDEIEDRQPMIYRLSKKLKHAAKVANWAQVLRAIRCKNARFPTSKYSFVNFLKELVVVSGER
jgi:hypothetical protein